MAKQEEITNRNKYRIPGGASYQLRTLNAVHISNNNSLKHELWKFIGSYLLHKFGDIKFSRELKKLITDIDKEVSETVRGWIKDPSPFITEAVPKREPDRRVDLVKLSDDTRFEFETKSIKKDNCVTVYL